MVASAVLGSVGPFVVMNHWQRFVTATEAGVLYSFGPVIATVAEVFLPAILSGWAGIAYANQPLTLSLFVGGALILAAYGLLQWKPAPKLVVASAQ